MEKVMLREVPEIIVIVIASIALYGWSSNELIFTRYVDGMPQMQVNTAICFLLLALSGLFQGKQRTAIAGGIAGTCLLISGLTMLEYLFHLNIGIDDLFFTSPIATDLFPGRMAPNTAMCFIASSLALLVKSTNYQAATFRTDTQLSLILIPLSLASFSLIGYLAGLEKSLSEGHVARMSIPTMSSFLFLCFGVLARINRDYYRNLIAAKSYLVLVCTLLSVIAWQMFVGYETHNIRTYTKENLANLTTDLEARIRATESAHNRMRDRWQANNGTSQATWRRDAHNYVVDQPWYQALQWVDAEGVVRWIEPLEGNKEAMGVNLNSEPVLSNLFREARINRQSLFSKSLEIDQGGQGVILAAPIFMDNGEFDGFLLGVFRLERLFTSVINESYGENFHITISFEGQTIYTSTQSFLKFKGSVTESRGFWQGYHISATTRPKLADSFRTPLPEMALLVGLIISALLGIASHYWRTHSLSLSDLASQKQQLAETLLVQRAFFERLGEAVVVIDEDATITEFTSAAQQLFGYSKFEMVGKNVNVLMPKDIAQYHDQYVRQFNPEKESSILGQSRELMGINKRGDVFPIEIIVTRVVLKGKTQFIGVIRDISELQKYKANLEEQKQKALAASQAKSEFLANMSHEIRTPMNGVLGALQLLQQTTAEDKEKGLISRALFSAKSLLTIINDILDFSKIEAKMLALESIEFSAKQVLESVVSDLLPVAKGKSIGLHKYVEEGFEDGWIGDPVRIRQVLLNLSSNAVKFTKEGHVSITLKSQTDKGSTALCFKVEDTGIGMSEEAVKSLFERFTQADSSTTRQFGGTGLGMSISHNLVSMMNGEIHVSSKEGKGTKFEVVLPLRKASSNLDITDKKTESGIPDLSDKKILIAEDNEINQTIVCSMLEGTKATLEIAENGKIALEKLTLFQPDFVFLDIHMPEMDGIEACIGIKRVNPHLPVIALTADVMADNIRHYEQVGFDGYLSKPIDMSEIHRTLTTFLLES